MQAELISTIKNVKFNGEETTVCQETMEARLEVEEPASVDTTPEMADDQEVPVQDAEVVPVGEPGKKRRDRRRLAAERRQKKEQKRTQRKDGCRRNLVAARRGTTRRVQVARHNFLSTRETRGYCGSQRRVIIVYRKMSRHATVAWRHRHIRSAVERATQSIGRLMKNLHSRQESCKEKRKTTSIVIGGWSSGRLSPLEERGLTYKILKMTLEMELAKQAKVMPSGLQRGKHWTLWRGRPPPKRKK
jgi:hypothetical protein